MYAQLKETVMTSPKHPPFQRPNFHSNQPKPPDWAYDPPSDARWHFYENAHGEQWVAVTSKDRLLVSGGDIDWDPIDIMGPDYAGLVSALWNSELWTFYAMVHKEWKHFGTATLGERLWLLSVAVSCLQDLSRLQLGPVR